MTFKLKDDENLIEQFEKILTLSLEQQLKILKQVEKDELFQTWETIAQFHICDSVERYEEGKPINDELEETLLNLGNVLYNLSLDVDSSEITPTDSDKSKLIVKRINEAITIVKKVEQMSDQLSESED